MANERKNIIAEIYNLAIEAGKNETPNNLQIGIILYAILGAYEDCTLPELTKIVSEYSKGRYNYLTSIRN